MYKLIILLIIIIGLILFFNPVYEGYVSPDLNWRNGVFIVRPPYEVSKLYTPYKNIMPTYQYEQNLIDFPRSE